MTFAPHFDCHAHVYERIHAVGKPRYLPQTPAPREDWRKHLRSHGLKGGVIIQTSFFGFDNSELLNALDVLGTERFRGVAAAPLDTSEEQLQFLKLRGASGVRWNLIRGASKPDLLLRPAQDFLRRLNRAGLHLEIQLEGVQLSSYLRSLSHFADRIVVDHFGLPSNALPRDEPWLGALRDVAPACDVWVKFSAPYRSAVDLQPHAEAILEIIGADRIVWGSDWPWTQHENRHRYAETIEWARSWFGRVDPAQTERASKRLYGFDSRDCPT